MPAMSAIDMLKSSNPFYEFVSAAFTKALPYETQNSLQGLVKWQPGVSPLSTNTSVAIALVVYLSTIFGIQALMKDQKPMRACL